MLFTNPDQPRPPMIPIQIEKEVLQNKLQHARGNVIQVAEELQISKTSLYNKLKRYGINAKDLR